MKTIKLFKAQAIGENQEIESVIIRIEKQFPMISQDDFDTKQDLDMHKQNAKLLFDAIINTLPGGTIDQLLILLLQEKASRYIVPVRSNS